MKKKFAALAVISIVALAVATYYSANALIEPQKEPATPTPTPAPPTPPTVTRTAWDNRDPNRTTEVIILTPQNGSSQTSNLTLEFNATTSMWAINSIYYRADWLSGDYHRIFGLEMVQHSGYSDAYTFTMDFAGVPVGNHTVEVVANLHDDSHAGATLNFTVGG